MFPKIKNHIFPLLLLCITSIISILNYTSGTFLTGWDTLHPEFDFGLNFQRLFEGVWRTEQGAGAVSGHSAMADIPRVIFMWILHFMLPLNSLRYMSVFSLLIIGPLGIYYFLKYILKENKNKQLISFLGALFYLFNLSTVQQFYVPFEMFPTQWAFLPWIMLFTLQFLETQKIKYVLYFSIITLLATPQAYAAHLWYAFFGTYLLFVMLYFFFQNKTKKGLQNSCVLIFLTLLLNSFWLLPNLYFIKTTSYVNAESKQNRIYSQEFRLRNRENGYIKDMALLKGFYVNWDVYDFKNQKNIRLMDTWNTHLQNPFIASIGYVAFFMVIGGIIISIVKKKNRNLLFLPFFIVPALFLLNHTFPFDTFFDFLLTVPLFEEALRFVFTKFSILLTFSYALYFALCIEYLFSFIKIKKIYVFSFFISLALFLYAFPLFQGELISPKMKIVIPQDYFSFWNFMKTQPDGTVLSLPMYTFSGWQYYNWGYQGSGFIWFGLKQPIFDRDSDRWSISNEEAFREFQYALYARNADIFVKDLQKFDVHYILWDKNNIAPTNKNEKQITYQNEIPALLSQLASSKKITKIAEFNNLLVYKINTAHPIVETKNIQNNILTSYRWNSVDSAYFHLGDYTTGSPDSSFQYNYPFRNITTVSDRIISGIIQYDPQKTSYFIYNAVSKNKMYLPSQKWSYDPQQIIKDNTQKGVQIRTENKKHYIHFKSNDFQTGGAILDYSLQHNQGYLLIFKSRNITGLPLRFCVKNQYSNICTLYDELSKSKTFVSDYYFIPPTDDGIGYGISTDNISFGDYNSINDLENITLIPLPYTFISNIFYSNNPPLIPQKETKIAENLIQKNRFIYELKISESQKNTTTVLWQSYHSGWHAYAISSNNFLNTYFPFVFGKELKNHILVDNWANGWKLDTASSQTIIILFWPQYLEFIGFGFVTICLVTTAIILYKSHKNRHD